MKFFKKRKNKGFTIIETLVAISVLSVSILATFTAVQSNLQTSLFARDQITAFYLIQEAVEFIRNMRDQNALQSLSNQSSGGSPVYWLHGISELNTDPCYFGKVCTVDSPKNALTYCNSNVFNSCPFLSEDGSTFLFGYNPAWPVTKFRREVQIQQVPGVTDEVTVVVRISWTSGLFSKTIQIQENILNTR